MRLKKGFQNPIAHLKVLKEKLCASSSLAEREEILKQSEPVEHALGHSPFWRSTLALLLPDERVPFLALLATGQDEGLLHGAENVPFFQTLLRELLDVLKMVERFYAPIGGVVGYHLTLLELIEPEVTENDSKEHLLCPETLDLTQSDATLDQSIRWGLEQLPRLCEIYPIGGAGDRLDLQHEATGEPLPTALLPFCGYNLLEGMIRDLQGREYLHYRVFGMQVRTPIAMMTSREKNNDQFIHTICESHQWFGRPRYLFFLFMQPLVPVVTVDGRWAYTSPLRPVLKPGGHGALWKLAEDHGVFDWLRFHNRQFALIRQINNPAAGLDNTLLAFSGWGIGMHKQFGFVATDRLQGASEGLDVVVEREESDGFSYCLTNIEYTEFQKRGLHPEDPACPFPANTNTLFASLDTVREKALQNPIPGQVVNLKTTFPAGAEQMPGGRLETTMQNIADTIVDHFQERLPRDQWNSLSTFAVRNSRNKALSPTKKLTNPHHAEVETPEGALKSYLSATAELLKTHCQMDVKGDFLFFYHPALGPLYEVIGQKVQGGILHPHAEMRLEIAELVLHAIDLEGSLIIEAEQPLGHLDAQRHLVYSDQGGKCYLRNVQIRNRGVDFTASSPLWKGGRIRHEAFSIQLAGNGEFYAEDVTFEGPFQIEVGPNERVIARMVEDHLAFERIPFSQIGWKWDYHFQDNNKIALTRIIL